MASNVTAAEVARFDRLAARWWDRAGPMRELHRMNPARIDWINTRITRRFGAGGVRLLDVGCGAGIAAERLAALGHHVTGLDAAPAAIAAAQAHAAETGVDVTYLTGELADLSVSDGTFQVITALEVIEHVPDPVAFLRGLAPLLAPGGLLFVSTLNRTARSFALAIVGAEYVAGLLPRGTHDWRRFVTPAELRQHFRAAGLRLADVAGLTRRPWDSWQISRDTGVNYIAMAEGPG